MLSVAVSRERAHLLVVGVKWPPETFIERRLRGLAARGMKLTVTTTSTSRGPDLPGLTVVRIPTARQFLGVTAARVVRHAVRLASADRRELARLVHAAVEQSGGTLPLTYAKLRGWLPLARIEPDLVHFEWNAAAIACLPLYDLWKCPVVVSCRGGQINVRPHLPDGEAYVAALKESLGRASAIHCVSTAIRAELEALGVDTRSAAVITPAVDPDVFRPRDRAAAGGRDGLRIVSVGSLIWRKGYEYALLALKELVARFPTAKLEIIGDGPERQRVLYTIHDLALTAHVTLSGALPTEEVVRALQRADVLLLSSLSEGISNLVLEGMACGLPVVTTDSGGMREAVLDGETGFVVAPRDVFAMAAALGRLATDEALRVHLGAAGRARVLERFTLTRQVDRFMELYGQLLEAR